MFMCFSLMLSNSSMRKNPASPNKHVRKNLKSEILEYFSLYFVTKALAISEVIGIVLVASLLTLNIFHIFVLGKLLILFSGFCFA